MSIKNEALSARAEALAKRGNILDSATVYLSGPMDFVADRATERATGWRTRVSQFLERMGTTVYDPWNKPLVSGMEHYGKEDEFSTKRAAEWTYLDTEEARGKRATLTEFFWPTLHIDLRMTDLADFVIAYCPTNTYSVGTVHEIALARQQHKPVLLVTPRLKMSKANELKAHLEAAGDSVGLQLLEETRNESIIRPNPDGVPSLWYMAMIESDDYFFDGFGFAQYMETMGWAPNPLLDAREQELPPQRPLLPYLERLNSAIPKRYSAASSSEVENAEWLIFVDEQA